MRTMIMEGSRAVYVGPAGEGWEDRLNKACVTVGDTHIECETIPVNFTDEEETAYVYLHKLKFTDHKLQDY